MANKQVLTAVFVFAATFNSLALWPAAACTAPKTPIGPIAEYAGDGHSSRFTAFYDGATRRYRHAVLGDAIEGSVLTMITPLTRDRCGLRVKLDLAHVFEDLSPRLVDLDGDKQPEVVTVRSHRDKGAQVAVYKITAGKLEMVASTPYIGRAHRWLAPIGAADLDGDGYIEIAYIDRPHLANELRIWRYQKGKLDPVSKASGLTNHRIGEDFITGGVRTCGSRPELITVDGGWSRIMATTLDRDGRINTRSIGHFAGHRSVVAALACKAG